MFDQIGDRIRQYALLMRMDRPIGTILLLWPALWGLWVAGEGRPRPWVLLVFLAGVFLMRSAGCVINDYADRDFDRHVARTKTRPIAAGQVSPQEALGLFIVLGATALALVLTLNSLTIGLALAAAALATGYPFTKRYIQVPQMVLGIAFSWSIPMAFAAQTNTIPVVAWWLVLANVFWVVAYDTVYAMVDREDDLRIGVKSSAILFGRYDRVLVALFQVLTLLVLYYVGHRLALNGFYTGSLLVAAGFAVYQQVLIRKRAAQYCFNAFLNNAWFGAAIFVGIVLSYL